MSQEINLKIYIAALRRRWWLVVLAMALAVAAALAYSAAQPKFYQASSTLLTQAPKYQWRFDASILPIYDSRRDYQREMLAIARTNRIAELAAGQLQAAGQAPEAILAAVSARAGDGSTIIITAKASEAQRAAAIANAWTAALLEQAQQTYGVSQELADYRAELESSSRVLAQLEDQLAEARARLALDVVAGVASEGGMLNVNQREILLKNQTLAEYRNDLDSLEFLRDLVQQAAPDADLAALPWELLDGPIISARGFLTPAIALELTGDRGALLALLEQEQQALEATAERLAENSLAVQAALAQEWRSYGEINRERALARETTNVWARKVAEAEAQQRVDPGVLSLISAATVPSSPVRTQQLALVLTAAALGLLVGALLALWLELGRSRQPDLSSTGSSQPEASH